MLTISMKTINDNHDNHHHNCESSFERRLTPAEVTSNHKGNKSENNDDNKDTCIINSLPIVMILKTRKMTMATGNNESTYMMNNYER